MTALLGSTEDAKHALAYFEAQLPELHAHLSNAAGWCEVFFVPKRSVTPELHAFLKALASLRERGQPIPDALPFLPRSSPCSCRGPHSPTSRASITNNLLHYRSLMPIWGCVCLVVVLSGCYKYNMYSSLLALYL
ncbi:hypothetical protein [Ktedonospora formicarum]|uniref:hypothetical protein n=1 Tax=Ktedonospora formicarum TaxID=2778364 RepID=UPI001C68BA3E|nr:hypothetical protein [Ktedonospora formicarum]